MHSGRRTLYRCRWQLPLLLGVVILLLSGCSVRKNNASTRFYHNLTTRYNVYFHGKNAFDEAYDGFVSNYTESYSQQIFLDPIEAQRGILKEHKGGAFDKAFAKGQMAIKLHSIRSKPTKKRNPSPREAEFFKRREYNTFLHHAWLLVGMSQFYNGDFLDAMATFSYMTRLYATEPAIRDEARLWQARSYVAMSWLHEAQELVNHVQRENQTLRKSQIYDKTIAEIALASGRPLEAIEPLRRAISKEDSSRSKMRMRYLLGQLLVQAGQLQEARKVYRTLLRKAPPFSLEFATNLRLVEIEAEKSIAKAIDQTKSMARRGRNKSVLDRLYLTQGELYLRQKDSIAALSAFNLGIERSEERASDFALCALSAGKIYLAQRNWDKAQQSFATGIISLPEIHPDHPKYSTLSKQLDELALHARAVAEQDSLRHLASLPEAEKLRIIDSAITAYEKAQKERKHNEQMEAQREQQEAMNEQMGANDRPNTPSFNPQNMPSSGEFYFYNPQLIAQGKATFKQKWGNRALEDDWRRRQKQITPSASTIDNATETPTTASSDSLKSSNTTNTTAPGSTMLSEDQDPTKRAYYLSQLPTTPEALAASDVIIQNGLLGMAKVFEEQMELYEEATLVLEELLRRYPDFEKRKEVYYQLYMLLERRGLSQEAKLWKQKIISEFAHDPLAKAMASPQYLQQLREAATAENQLYDAILSAYMRGASEEVRSHVNTLHEQYPLSPLKPKADYLKALSYVLDGDAVHFKQALEKLLETYQKDEVLEPAQEILRELTSGRNISKGGYSGLDYDAVFYSTDEAPGDSLPAYQVPPIHTPHCAVLLFPDGSVDRNTFLFALTSFNFARYTNLPLDLSLEQMPSALRLTITGFPSEATAWSYVRDAYSPEGYMSLLSAESLLFAIDDTNYKMLLQGGALGQYFDLLADSIAQRESAVALALMRYEEQKKRAEQSEVLQPAPSEEKKQGTQPIEPKHPQPEETSSTGETQASWQVNERAPISYEDVEKAAKERRERERLEAKEKKRREEEARKQREADKKAKAEARKQREEEIRKQREADKNTKVKNRQ